MTTGAMTHDAFLSATQSATWTDIDALVQMLDDAEFWDDAFLAASLEQRKKAYVRRAIKQIKDADGWPVYASVTTVDPVTGEEERRYKQEVMFDAADYVQVVRYNEQRAQHFIRMAEGYAKRGHERYGVQLTMDFFPIATALAAD